MTDRPRTTLLLVCKDLDRENRPQHPSVELARIDWTPPMVQGFAVWTAGDAEAEETPEAIAESTRQTRRGETRVRNRSSVHVVARADGGRTFHLPRCPRCGREMEVRDDRLAKLRSWPRESFDVSLRGW